MSIFEVARKLGKLPRHSPQVLAKSHKPADSYFWFVCSVIFSVFIVSFSNPLLTFFNVSILFYSLSALIGSGYKMSLFHGMIFPVLNTVFIFFAKDNNLRLWPTKSQATENKPKQPFQWVKFILTSLISLVVFVIVSLILASSNVFFAEIFGRIFEFFSFLNFFRFIFLDVIFNLRFYSAFVLAYIIKKAISYLGDHELQHRLNQDFYGGYEATLNFLNKHIGFVWPKIVTGFLILVFFVTQIQLYIAVSSDASANQDKVREIFFQLLVVTLIVLSLVFVDTSKKVWHKIVSYFLLFEGFFLTLNALKSNFDYVVGFGLGPQRLYGFAAGILSIFLILLTAQNVANRKDSWYLKTTLALICVTFIGISLVNFDRLMYDFNAGRSDVSTRPQELSSDSRALDDVYFELKNKPEKNSDEFNRLEVAMDKIEWLQKKESANQWQTFNFSDYFQNQESDEIQITQQEREDFYKERNDSFNRQNSSNEESSPCGNKNCPSDEDFEGFEKGEYYISSEGAVEKI